MLCRRDNREKIEVALDDLEAKAGELLEQIQTDMLERARAHRDYHTYVAENMEQLEETLNTKPGFVKAMWCGDQACEEALKEENTPLPDAVCLSSRSSLPIPAFAAESRQSIWFTGARRINLSHIMEKV